MDRSPDPIINHQVPPVKPEEPKNPPVFDFDGAVKELLKGNKVTRQEWNNRDIYFLLKDTRMKIHKADGSVTDLILTEGDLLGTDYFIV